jgi:hypothetical protein
VLVRVARWDALGSALKEDVRVRLAVSTMALPGDTPYAPGAGAIRRFEIREASRGGSGFRPRPHLSGRRLVRVAPSHSVR